MEKLKGFEQWFLQSDYDFETAEHMLKTGRYIYCIFFCHLSLEKALKGLYTKETNEYPAKTHNLNYFVKKLNLQLSEEYSNFINELNAMSIPTRYPEDLQKMITLFSKGRTKDIINQTKIIQQWIKEK